MAKPPKHPPLPRLAAFLIALLLVVAGSATPALAADLHPEVATGTIISTDVDGSGSTTLLDVAYFGCAYLQGPTCPPNPGLPCDCSGGYSQSDFAYTCDGVAGLNDLAIMATAYITGVTTTWKCP